MKDRIMLNNELCAISCYAVFCNEKQIRVYHVGFSKAESIRQFNNAKTLADNNAISGYPCIIKSFNSSAIHGRIVYETSENK